MFYFHNYSLSQIKDWDLFFHYNSIVGLSTANSFIRHFSVNIHSFFLITASCNPYQNMLSTLNNL